MTSINRIVKPVRPIGILGGTFDPIHLGHLQLAKELYHRLQLQEVRFIPCYQSALKHPPLITAEQRLELVRLACQSEKNFVVDDREIRRKAISYTYNTLLELRQEFGNLPLCLLMATDVFTHFTRWYHWQEVIQLTHLAVVSRPGFSLIENQQLHQLIQQHQAHTPEQLCQAPGGYILFTDFPETPISGTEIRQRLATRQDVKDLLPRAVWQYIAANKLYQNPA